MFFCFYIYCWWFMDCFASLAMTKGWWFVVYGLLFARKNKGASGVCGLLFVRNDSTHTSSLRELLCNSWQSQYGNHCTQHTPSLRGFKKAVAISVWDTINHSWNSFSFLFFVLTFCGLWIASSPCSSQWRREWVYLWITSFYLQWQGGWMVAISFFLWINKRLVVVACFLFAMTVPTHRHCEILQKSWQSIRNWKLKIENWKLIFH